MASSFKALLLLLLLAVAMPGFHLLAAARLLHRNNDLLQRKHKPPQASLPSNCTNNPTADAHSGGPHCPLHWSDETILRYTYHMQYRRVRSRSRLGYAVRGMDRHTRDIYVCVTEIAFYAECFVVWSLLMRAFMVSLFSVRYVCKSQERNWWSLLSRD